MTVCGAKVGFQEIILRAKSVRFAQRTDGNIVCREAGEDRGGRCEGGEEGGEES